MFNLWFPVNYPHTQRLVADLEHLVASSYCRFEPFEEQGKRLGIICWTMHWTAAASSKQLYTHAYIYLHSTDTELMLSSVQTWLESWHEPGKGKEDKQSSLRDPTYHGFNGLQTYLGLIENKSQSCTCSCTHCKSGAHTN